MAGKEPITAKHLNMLSGTKKPYQPNPSEKLSGGITLTSVRMQALKDLASYFSWGKSTPEVSISQLWIYPLKSARGVRVNSARVSAHGFEHDRVFMLVEEKPMKEGESKTQWCAMTMRTWPKVVFYLCNF